MMTTYLARMFPSRLPCTITASQFSTSAVMTTNLPTTSTLLVPGGTMEAGPAAGGFGFGLETSFFKTGGRGGAGAGAGGAAAAAGSGEEEEVVGAARSLAPRNDDDDFFLNMMMRLPGGLVCWSYLDWSELSLPLPM